MPLTGCNTAENFSDVIKKPEKWDEVQMKTYEIKLPGSPITITVKADQEVHEKDHGFLMLYVEGSLVARIPKEALIVITGKLHK